MPQEQVLQVDFVQKSSVNNILPKPPLSSSHHLGWNGILVQHHYQPAWELSEYITSKHLVSIHHSTHTLESERVLDGKRKCEQIQKGDIALVPADIPHQKLWQSDCEFTLLLLDPIYIAHIAHETVDGDRVHLLPHFAEADPLIYQIGTALKSALTSEQPSTHLYIDSLSTALAAHLIMHYSTTKLKISMIDNGLPKQTLEKVIDYIYTHLGQEVTLSQLANLTGMSQYYFCRLFKQSTGLSPHQYLIQKRVEQAKQLLIERKSPIADIALQCGFTNQSHLNRHFKRIVGVTPLTFQRQ
ncbi:helix-turn-helix transcriptional regulator [Oscillatoria sp. FACHB-1407]|uniref:AraC family transcriptional regulator n=1 Tax=Oscillatoria sp. FACHB-1407 TaxID=2692847 RepID=UPI00168456DF|nr:AraC family transcriptional regulator [Oscillatoria sp. FACHB-1407]MBD2466005.1 helix-turn-helix transcriptional regulator [Oscillatoria sp. FACHB-1407]